MKKIGWIIRVMTIRRFLNRNQKKIEEKMPTDDQIKQLSNYILNNEYINNYLNKVELEWRDDFRQEMWTIFMDYITNDYDRMYNLYVEGKLGKYMIGIISNQLISNNSSFYKKFKKVRKNNVELTQISEYKVEDEYFENRNITVEQILLILNNQMYYDAVLFKLYYGICPITNEIVNKRTYKEIAKLIGLKDFQTIRNNIISTKKIIISKCS